MLLLGAIGCVEARPAVSAPVRQGPSVTAPRQDDGLRVSVDTDSAKAILDAVLNPALTMPEALKIAALPGSQGLIRKARSYGRPGTDDLFAKALMSVAHNDNTAPDPALFKFGQVRDHAEKIRATLARLEDPSAKVLSGVRARIDEFAPADLSGPVAGHLIVGGTSGGFAFGDPEFFLNLDRVPSAPLASTIMQHELFHAVQGMARTARKPSDAANACTIAIPHGKELTELFQSLEMEGSASLVGDIVAMPAGIDTESDKARDRALRNVGLVNRSVTLLELSVHGLNTGAEVSYGEVYALGFYGDEVLYALGYVMARAIAAEQGKRAIADLTGRPGALFVQRYQGLQAYGKSDAAPALRPETLRAANQLAACLLPG